MQTQLILFSRISMQINKTIAVHIGLTNWMLYCMYSKIPKRKYSYILYFKDEIELIFIQTKTYSLWFFASWNGKRDCKICKFALTDSLK